MKISDRKSIRIIGLYVIKFRDSGRGSVIECKQYFNAILVHFTPSVLERHRVSSIEKEILFFLIGHGTKCPIIKVSKCLFVN